MMETSNLDTLEGLAGAIQNLTAGKCRFAAVLREAVRSEKGLPVIVDLLKWVIEFWVAFFRLISNDEKRFDKR